MMPLIVYLLRSYSASQRYFAPMAGILIPVLILYSYTPNPVMSSYAATAVILFAGSAWLGLSFLNHQPPVQRQVSAVHMRSAVRYSFGELLTLIILTLSFTLIIVLYPLVTGSFDGPAGMNQLVMAITGHFLCGLLGVVISLYLQASWIPKHSYAIGLMMIVIILSIGGAEVASFVPGLFVQVLLPPVSSLMEEMMHGDSPADTAFWGAALHALIYISLLAGMYLLRTSRKDFNKSM
ncbi:hypothetical protein C2I18_28945 [Paenibacillus sp. PK3_47]|uniref:hypothetical protein n=1 Tax=Paenibacillus sp. PK3_47 TaxID=2072642 RepID=UPI00201E542E|nr:hypothetical protein [Paenibacillus sp. PK3_47]UQZ37213.1 hypothetical protein C2I18_28945 [Paenibacillus sp. PK3_47]